MIKNNTFLTKYTILTSIFIGGLYLSSCSQSSVKEFISQALELIDSGKQDDALAMYNAAIKKYPQVPILYVLKGELITKFNKRLTTNDNVYYTALKEFNIAIELDSTFYPAYSSRGFLNLVHQNYESAIKDFTNALRLTNGDPEKQFNALADRANAKLYSKDYNGAINDYDQALKIRPNDSRVQINLGSLYVNTEQFEKAENKFTEALLIDPKNIDALSNLAALHLLQKKPKSAISILEKAIQIYPDEPDLYSNLGLAKIKIGQPLEALKEINKALKLYPDDSYAYKHRAMAYVELGKIAEACDDLIKANQLGYSISFDNEVNELINKYCKK